jgi:hypothetical protein
MCLLGAAVGREVGRNHHTLCRKEETRPGKKIFKGSKVFQNISTSEQTNMAGYLFTL